MEIPSLVIGILLFAASLVFVSLPFRQSQRSSPKKSKADSTRKGRREAVLSALRDLDFDFKTGKVGEEDYAPLRAQLLVEAAQYIQQEEARDADMEARIRARRQARGKSLAAYCPHCGKKARERDFFCTACGGALKIRAEGIS